MSGRSPSSQMGRDVNQVTGRTLCGKLKSSLPVSTSQSLALVSADPVRRRVLDAASRSRAVHTVG